MLNITELQQAKVLVEYNQAEATICSKQKQTHTPFNKASIQQTKRI